MVQTVNDSQLIVLHEMRNKQQNLLRSVLLNEPLNFVIEAGLIGNGYCQKCRIAAPARWGFNSFETEDGITNYIDSIPVNQDLITGKNNSYLIISNGRYQSNLDYAYLRKLIESLGADITLINLDQELSIGHEKLQLTLDGKLAGIRRIYSDSVQRAPIPDEWPHLIFIRKSALPNIINEGISADFNDFKKLLQGNLNAISVNIGASVTDIEKPDELLGFVTKTLKTTQLPKVFANLKNVNAKCYGTIHVAQNVQIGENVKLIGPALICDNAAILNGAVVANTIIGSEIEVPSNTIVANQLIMKSDRGNEIHEFESPIKCDWNLSGNNFKTWPRLSYAGFFKRTVDIIAASLVLILFAPVMAIIAMIIKSTSRGPVFFGHVRQGLHGKSFKCLKFRSMIIGADDLQRKLRIKNEVDGPQFKMEDDPRVTPIGKFLRDTYLDEIPQFLNVFLGQMSLMGPRPSPEAENSLCAYWRDARLSVRPGITGLWQVCRTRKTGNDFQEWVHYDSEYVRQLSFKLDLWIFWRTVKYLVRAFLKQF